MTKTKANESEKAFRKRMVKEHSKWFIGTIKKIYEGALDHGIKHGIEYEKTKRKVRLRLHDR